MFSTIISSIPLIVQTIITWPIIEYSIHYGLHKFNNKKHKLHHIEAHTLYPNNFNSLAYIEPFYITLPIFYYLRCYSIFLGLAWYYTVHTIIHFKPELLPDLSKHHSIHHHYPHLNYGVTTPIIDIIMCTKKILNNLN